MLKLGSMVFLMEKIFLKICNQKFKSATYHSVFVVIHKKKYNSMQPFYNLCILLKMPNHLSILITIYPVFNKIYGIMYCIVPNKTFIFVLK
jgi:hypothetical protein